MFWENFFYLCSKARTTPNAVARELGIKSTGTVTAWKNGAKPRRDTLEKIAEHFNVDIDDLDSDVFIGEKRATLKNEDDSDKPGFVQFSGLTPEEEIAIRAYHAGLLAARKQK